MGKNGSKHECFLVNAHLNKAWEEQIWKKTTKTGYNLANYNMNQSMSELSICLEDKRDNSELKDNNTDNNVPLTVELPPIKADNDTGKVFTFDQMDEKENGEKELDSRLNIEEFECGVHFGGGDNSKQEWSFTLYDFDGHGKITKEDLVGLLKALYDAIGSSVKIPNNGTKTLKLRLSVGQDTNTAQENNARQQALLSKADDKKDKEDISDTKNTPKKTDYSKSKDTSRPKEVAKQKEAPKVKVKEFSKLNNLTANQKVPNKCNNQTQVQPLVAQSALVKPRGILHKNKELAELVQANMERNHIRHLRRHLSDCKGCPQRYHSQALQNKRRLHSARTTNSAKDNNLIQTHVHTKCLTAKLTEPTHNNLEEDDVPKESQDRRNYYLDLAGVENTSSKFQDSTNSALAVGKNSELNNASTSKFHPMRFTSALPAGQVSSVRHLRSRSHELNEGRVENHEPELGECCAKISSDVLLAHCDHVRSRSFDSKCLDISNVRATKGNPHFMSSTPKQSKFKPVRLPTHVPNAVSPHYHRRHRHREKDHDLAMQQVAEWIEREHTLEFEGEKVVIEHHHVHEHHHHHHYHHYYET